MKHKLQLSRFDILIWIAAILLFSQCKPQATENMSEPLAERSMTLLKDYVHAPDPAFRYETVHSSSTETYDYVVLKMVSQNWLSKDIVNETEWWHWVSVVIPKDTPYQTGMMWIGGGSKDSKMPTEPGPLVLETAQRTNSIVAEIHNVPFQPVVFANDTFGERYEDAIIAYGWRKFLEGGAKDEDAIWLARLPMTKAVKLAMDVATEIAGQKGKTLDKFVVAGASKRGWTTWTTAAVDDRVVAFVPIVIDLLNIQPSFQHHWRNYGFWAPAVEDYVREGIMDWQGSAEYARLLEITEPYSFLEAYANKPKLLINAAGDQFFLPDSWKFYWDSLPGEKHLQYVPNFGHDLRESDALPNMISFYASVLNKADRPSYSWKIEGDKIILQTDPNQKPASIKLWSANNPEARDFRIDVLGPKWTSSEILVNEKGTYEIAMKQPEKGFTAYFVEVVFPGQAPIKLTTGVEVLPRTYPFESFESENPMGTQQ